ncbi:decapping 5 protein [Nymphaea thermarum]|nr:decapping 5 protein [Nymphaea thermarum]
MGDASTGRSGGGSTDSYIGSLISLTSKCEIRYEGILYNINTEESSIGLRNVRSFGTEGRKKDGQQIPPSDKVYEYILFRGSDIKVLDLPSDLQVKSSPPVQATPPPIHNDPAIIQAISLFTSGINVYKPSVGSWGSTPQPPNANGGGLAMPMYWQGFYGPSNGLPHVQQQPMPFRPPPGLGIPPAMQQHFPYPSLSAPLQTSSTSSPELPNPIQPPVSSTVSTSISLPSTLASAQLPPLSSETSTSLISNKAPLVSLSSAGASVSLPLASSLVPAAQEINAIVTPLPSKPTPVRPSTLAYQTVSQSVSSITGVSTSMPSETSMPSLITPNQLLHPRASAPSSHQPLPAVQKDVEVVVSSSSSSSSSSSTPAAATAKAAAAESPALVSADAKGPLLPLPKTSEQKINGAHRISHVGSRGRERGRGHGGRGVGNWALLKNCLIDHSASLQVGRSVTQFTEDFDFMAMNEKFNKDEVWGHLGKTQSQQRDKSVDLEDDDADDGDIEDKEDNAHFSRVEMKVAMAYSSALMIDCTCILTLSIILLQPVYVKDDFFDSLSCNALDQGSRNGRTKFSEQMKIDTETFGDFPRHRGGRGGRGAGRRGNFRGSYYGGRGYGYGGRGRNQMVSARDQ